MSDKPKCGCGNTQNPDGFCDGFFGGITNWPESKKPNFTNCNPN